MAVYFPFSRLPERVQNAQVGSHVPRPSPDADPPLGFNLPFSGVPSFEAEDAQKSKVAERKSEVVPPQLPSPNLDNTGFEIYSEHEEDAMTLKLVRRFLTQSWPRDEINLLAGQPIVIDHSLSIADQMNSGKIMLPLYTDMGEVLPFASRIALMLFSGAKMIEEGTVRTTRANLSLPPEGPETVLAIYDDMVESLPLDLNTHFLSIALPQLVESTWDGMKSVAPAYARNGDTVHHTNPRYPLYFVGDRIP